MEMKKILMPNGEMRTYYRGDTQTWRQIIDEVILPHWERYCNANWLSVNHEAVYAPEKRVKWFLDRLGWLLAEGGENIESEYKKMVHEVREIPFAECPAEITDAAYSGAHVRAVRSEDPHWGKLVDRLEEKDKRPGGRRGRSARRRSSPAWSAFGGSCRGAR